ncbi:hypothetical protein ACKFKF_25325 [Phormidesmis sp. 146-12]
MKLQKATLPSKAKWASKVIGVSLLSVPLMVDFTQAQARSPALQIGFKFQASQQLNVGTIMTLSVTEAYTVDSGRCHGPFYYSNFQTRTRRYTEETGRAEFISNTMLPAPGLRVVIRNVTPGIDQNPPPYTDREYDKASTSEGFRVSFGTSHSGRHLAVQPGKNDFSYEIKRGNTVLESGTFIASIDHQTKSVERGSTSRPYSFSIGKTDEDRQCEREYSIFQVDVVRLTSQCQ